MKEAGVVTIDAHSHSVDRVIDASCCESDREKRKELDVVCVEWKKCMVWCVWKT